MKITLQSKNGYPLRSMWASYIPILPRASPTHLLAMAAAIKGTMYLTPPSKGGGGKYSDSAHDIPAILFWVLIA